MAWNLPDSRRARIFGSLDRRRHSPPVGAISQTSWRARRAEGACLPTRLPESVVIVSSGPGRARTEAPSRSFRREARGASRGSAPRRASATPAGPGPGRKARPEARASRFLSPVLRSGPCCRVFRSGPCCRVLRFGPCCRVFRSGPCGSCLKGLCRRLPRPPCLAASSAGSPAPPQQQQQQQQGILRVVVEVLWRNRHTRVAAWQMAFLVSGVIPGCAYPVGGAWWLPLWHRLKIQGKN